MKLWAENASAMVAVACESERALLDLAEAARAAGIIHSVSRRCMQFIVCLVRLVLCGEVQPRVTHTAHLPCTWDVRVRSWSATPSPRRLPDGSHAALGQSAGWVLRQ